MSIVFHLWKIIVGQDSIPLGKRQSLGKADAHGHYVRLEDWKQDAAEKCLEVIRRTEERGDASEQSVIADIMNVFGETA